METIQPITNYTTLKDVPRCKFCTAKRSEYDPPTFCCGNGVVRHISHQAPTTLRNLYLWNTNESEQFRTYIITYNNIFAFTSLEVSYDKELAKEYKGISTFRFQGKMYHFIDDLVQDTEKRRNLQLHFFDSENELRNRLECSSKLNEGIVQKLLEILNTNPYSIFLKSLINIPQLYNFYIL